MSKIVFGAYQCTGKKFEKLAENEAVKEGF